ncbi:hypothetical protein K469DRAFT_708417 [Zopfia rhizophila CBS 207.26]|uniref:Uncharacterized protein n=1 Tax=Zopfia rhizophila CBS 207.26 TaxID=1314779 RepID=A0A6A6E295_9PEZI|nr:hypothetical protein K469DRAFT_708417 [Zopfia rhizophila CBS 207.26]
MGSSINRSQLSPADRSSRTLFSFAAPMYHTQFSLFNILHTLFHPPSTRVPSSNPH